MLESVARAGSYQVVGENGSAAVLYGGWREAVVRQDGTLHPQLIAGLPQWRGCGRIARPSRNIGRRGKK